MHPCIVHTLENPNNGFAATQLHWEKPTVTVLKPIVNIFAADFLSVIIQCLFENSLDPCNFDLQPFCPKMGISVTYMSQSISSEFEVSNGFRSGPLDQNWVEGRRQLEE